MTFLYSLRITAIRIGVVVALVGTSLLSPPVLAFFPVLTAVGYLFTIWHPISLRTLFMADIFLFFALPLLFSQGISDYFAWTFSVPIILLIDNDLKEEAKTAKYSRNSFDRLPTRITIALSVLIIAQMLIAIIFNSIVLLLTDAVAVLCLTALLVTVCRTMPSKPVNGPSVEERVVAGSQVQLVIKMNTVRKVRGTLFLEPLQRWVKMPFQDFHLNGEDISFSLHISPALSGVSVLQVKGYAIDKWGLWQTQFIIEPVRLIVIPRARYATWIAKRYLAESQTGMFPLISTVSSLRPILGLRAGVEYYGSQLYQPGDSLKNIDWKRSIKYNNLVSKEFADLHSQPAILLVNMSVTDAGDADKQIYNIIVTALSLAIEQIPTALALYDEKDVQLVTTMLQPQVLISRCLGLVNDITTIGKPTKYLNPPNISTLHANIRRLESVGNTTANNLAQLLKIEYDDLKEIAVNHPVTRALVLAFKKNGDRANVVVVSRYNHDVEAIMFNTIAYQINGNRFLRIA